MSFSVKQQMKRSRRNASTFWGCLANPDPHRVDDSVFWGWLGVLAFGVLSFGAVEPWSLATFQVGTAVLSVWWIVSGMYRRSLPVSVVPLFIPAVLFLALIGEQLVGRTAYRFATENSMFLYLTCGALVFVGVQVLNSERRFRNFGLAAAGFGIGVAVLAVLQNLTSPREIYWSIYPEFGDGVFGPYVNHSHYSGLMEMLMPLPFVIGAARLLPRSWRPICFGAGAVMVGSVFLSGSRGGIVAVIVQLCLLYFLLRGRSRHRDDPAPKRRLSISIVSSLAVLALILWLGGQEMVGRISSMKDPYGNTVGATRILIARDCLHMFAQRPMLGWGAGVFAAVYPAFRSFSTDLVVNAAHNDYLQLLVEYGVAGAVLAVIFIAIAYRRVGHLAKHWSDSWPHAVSYAALLGTVGILVHSLTDFNLQIPANAAIFYVMCMVASHSPAETKVEAADEC